MITTFGEIMLRISPSDVADRIIQATDFQIRPGGSESNVAIALANLGLDCAFVTSLPDSTLGQTVLRHLRQNGVNTDYIKLKNDRMGMYWTENGTGPRNSFVIYDRANSAFSQCTYNDFEWEKIFKNTDWFHFSGISPAVSANVANLLEKVVANIDCPYSVDLNFRKNLWQWLNKDKSEIRKTMLNICSKTTLLAGNESDFQNIFGFNGRSADEKEAYVEIAHQCFDTFPNLNFIAISNRVAYSASHNGWSGFLFARDDENFCYQGLSYNLDNIQDRVGTGDSFSAGIIYGLGKQKEMIYQEVVDFAVTLGALNHTTKGDASSFTAEEVLSVMKSGGTGRIIR